MRGEASPLRLADRRVTVMGLGLQGGGVEVARFLAARGARVTVTDLRPAESLAESVARLDGLGIELALGRHREEDFAGADLVVANPAVAPASPWLAAARNAGVRITSEMELFLAACPARVALVTGTQGKSSTCHLLAGLLAAAGARVHLGGNIGRSLLGALPEMTPQDVAVVEISSYQLEALPPDVERLGGRVAAVCALNVLPDHLERHGTMEAYEAAKRRLLELAGERCHVLLAADDPRIAAWTVEHGRRIDFGAAAEPALGLRDGHFALGDRPLARIADLGLAGAFQRVNALAALGLAHALGAEPARLAAGLRAQRGLAHRLEDLGPVAGHRVWDNGVSTTPDSTVSALEHVRATRGEDADGLVPVVLIAGGRAKALDYAPLARAAAGVRATALFGACAGELAAAWADAGARARPCAALEEAVDAAYAAARPGDEILFSPACASFDAHRNWEERARAFRAALARHAARGPEDERPEARNRRGTAARGAGG